MIDLDGANKLMAGLEYLNGPAAENIFSHLISEIGTLRRDGDVFDVPSGHEPYAWRRAFIILKKLRQRERLPRNPQVVADEVAEFNSAKDWNAYLTERTQLIGMYQRDMIKDEDLQYLGLLPGDLGPPTSKDPEALKFGGKRPGWSDIAGRISHALGRWQGMSKDEKNTIPGLMAARRAEAKTIALERRIAILEAAAANMLKPEVGPIVDEHSAA